MGFDDYYTKRRKTSMRMPKDFHGFAEKAIEIAAESGERKRAFKKETAGALAKSQLAKEAKTQQGLETRHLREFGPEGARTREGELRYGVGSLEERISEADRIAKEAGLEARHLREFGPEGVRARESELRYGVGGLEERLGQVSGETTASKRLSDARRKQEGDIKTKKYEAETRMLFEPFLEKDLEGGASLPVWLNKLYLEGNLLALDDPAKASAFLREGVARHEEEAMGDEAWFEGLQGKSLSELKAMR